jgi:DNA-binding phage protein
MGKLQGAKGGHEVKQPLTRPFSDTVEARAKRDSRFRQALFGGAIEEILDGEFGVAKRTLRHLVNATIGFPALSDATDIPPKSLMRMFSEKGNPRAENLIAVLAALREDAGLSVAVRVTKPRAGGSRRPPMAPVNKARQPLASRPGRQRRTGSPRRAGSLDPAALHAE